MNDGGGVTLRNLYAREISKRGFQQDAAQLAAIDCLEEVRGQLLAHTPAEHSPLRHMFDKALQRAPRAPVRGLYLWGAVGRGKTWLMDLFFQSLPFPQKLRRHFHRFMQDVHTQLRELGPVHSPLEIVAARIAASARVLCFDELFVADIADAMILGALFAALFRRGVTLIATSNVPPHELYRDGLQRQRFLASIALLERHTRVLAVDGGVDYRLRQLTQADVYLDAHNPQTAQHLQTLFDSLVDGGSSAAPLQIEGRPIAVVLASHNAVWFEFAAICEGPRSQDDYIEIAHEFHTVIVSDVPVFDALHEDAARRFIALVDELYDRAVNLVLSAAAPPQQLYRGALLRQEFERTSSRLMEMRSRQYLAREHRP